MNKLTKPKFFLENFLRINNIIKDIYVNNCILVKVLKTKGNYLLVDGNLKSISYIKKDEFLSENISISSILGKYVKVLIINLDNGYGNPVLSREKYFSRIFWRYISSSLIFKKKVAGLLIGKIKGGFTVMISKFKCFLPFSEVDKKILLNYNFYKNKKLFYNLISFNYKKKNIVLSRKTLQYNSTMEGQLYLINILRTGHIVKGIVKGFSSYGVYIDLGFLDALILLKNISWGPRRYANEILEINKGVLVKILKIDKPNRKVYAGIKQIFKNPWKNIFDKYKVGYLKYGRVFKITNENIYLIFELGVFGFIKKFKIIKTLNDKSIIDKIKINNYLKVVISYINFKKRFVGFVLYRKGLKINNKNKSLIYSKIINKKPLNKKKIIKKLEFIKNPKLKIYKLKNKIKNILNKNIKIIKIIKIKKPSLAQ